MKPEVFDEEFWSGYFESDPIIEPEFDSFVVDRQESSTKQIYFPVPELNPEIEKQILEFMASPLVDEPPVAVDEPPVAVDEPPVAMDMSPVAQQESPPAADIGTLFSQLSPASQFAVLMANQHFPPDNYVQPPQRFVMNFPPVFLPSPAQPLLSPAPPQIPDSLGEEPPSKRHQAEVDMNATARTSKKGIPLFYNLPESKRDAGYYYVYMIKQPMRTTEIKKFPSMPAKEPFKSLVTLRMPNIIMVNIRQVDIKFVGFSTDPGDYNIELASDSKALFDIVTIYYKHRPDLKEVRSRRYEDLINSLTNVEAQSVNAYLMLKCKPYNPSTMMVRSRKGTAILNVVMQLCEKNIEAADILCKYFDYIEFFHLGLLAQKMNVPLITKIVNSVCMFTREFIRENLVRYFIMVGPTDFVKIDYLIDTCGLRIRMSAQDIIDSPTSLGVVDWLWENNINLTEVLNLAFHYEKNNTEFIKHRAIIERLLNLGVKVGKNNSTFRAILARNDAWAFEHFLYAGHELDNSNIASIASSVSIDIFDFMQQRGLIDNTNVEIFIKNASVRAFNWFLTNYSISLQRIYDILSRKGDKKMCQWFLKKYKFVFVDDY